MLIRRQYAKEAPGLWGDDDAPRSSSLNPGRAEVRTGVVDRGDEGTYAERDFLRSPKSNFPREKL